MDTSVYKKSTLIDKRFVNHWSILWPIEHLGRKAAQGGIHKLRWQTREEWVAKCQRYYISLCNKLVNEGGGGGSNNLKILST